MRTDTNIVLVAAVAHPTLAGSVPTSDLGVVDRDLVVALQETEAARDRWDIVTPLDWLAERHRYRPPQKARLVDCLRQYRRLPPAVREQLAVRAGRAQ